MGGWSWIEVWLAGLDDWVVGGAVRRILGCGERNGLAQVLEM